MAKVSRAGVMVDEQARGDADRPLASVAPPGGWEYGALIMGDAETRGRVLVSRFGGPAYWKRESPYCTTVRQGPRRSRKMCQPARSVRWIAGDDRPFAEGVAAAHRMS